MRQEPRAGEFALLAGVTVGLKSLAARLIAKTVAGADGCVEFVGCDHRKGYGEIYVGKRNGRNIKTKAHRAAYFVFSGDVPPGRLVMHKCDNRKCINPDHLSLGSNADNMRDMVAKGRSGTCGGSPRRGSQSPSALLTETSASMVLGLRGSVTARQLAERLGVKRQTISNIWMGIRWAHVKAMSDSEAKTLFRETETSKPREKV
jgi:hypothetical protein